MYKQLPSRNQRSQGIKVKHVLQICLLLAVCFWLIYQVKHSHDRKKEFDENDGKNLLDSARKDEVVKLGRKDLHPLKEGTLVESDKHGEEAEDEELEEETLVEEENKHEDEGEENKTEVDNKNEEKRAAEEELDAHEQEKSDMGNEKGGEEVELDGHDQEKSDMGNEKGGEEGEIDGHDQEKSDMGNEKGGEEEELDGHDQEKSDMGNENEGEEEELDGHDQEKSDMGNEKEGEEEELDGHDQEKSDMENDREEESIDEEKEQEDDGKHELKDRESDDNNGKSYTGNASEEHTSGGGIARRHEARDENYKADDASSAVTLDTQTTSTGDDTLVLGKSNEQGGADNLEPQYNLKQNDGVDVGRSASVNVEGGATTNKYHLGKTTNEQSKTIISNSSMTETSTTRSSLPDESGRVQDFSKLNDSRTVSENNEDQKFVEEHKKSSESSKLEISDLNLKDNSTFPVNSDLQGLNVTVSSESKSTDPNLEGSHTDGVTESSNSELKYHVTSKAEENSSMEKSSLTENPQDDEVRQINESLYDIKLDNEDSSDSKLSLEEKDVRTDLETLPDIKIEGSNTEDAAAE